ncbi:MAG: TlpA family protein disulfide reductase [Gammaproteobacteria bacterium]|nr:TlpA family protein disulfide reductase [Gammaproteobacteria bacterium]NND54022.1 TlpA family protein disulfide reductase [Gammaproteobacteria bacterium]
MLTKADGAMVLKGQTTRRAATIRTLLRRSLIATVCASLPVALSAGTAELIGVTAPDFALPSTTGKNLRLSEYRSDVVVLNFWAEWCGKCNDAVQTLDTLSRQHQADGLRVFAVDVDGEHGAHLAAKAGLSYPVLLDIRSEVSKTYDLKRLPVTVLIDREGTVRFVQNGFKGEAERQLRAEVTALLSE